MIKAFGAVGNGEAAVGLLKVAAKHGLRASAEMYSAGALSLSLYIYIYIYIYISLNSLRIPLSFSRSV